MPPPASPEMIFLVRDAAMCGIRKTWRKPLRMAQ
jgi:hypothetical protein